MKIEPIFLLIEIGVVVAGADGRELAQLNAVRGDVATLCQRPFWVCLPFNPIALASDYVESDPLFCAWSLV